MSENSLVHAAPNATDHGHEGKHGTRQSYLIGFALSVVLTAIPFWLVMADIITSSRVAGIAIMVLAAIQIVVHMVYFLHMNTKSEQGWNMLALIFTVVIVVITLAGSLWVMFHLNNNMMPMSQHEMKNMP